MLAIAVGVEPREMPPNPAQITAALDELTEAGGNLLRCVLDPGVGAGVQGFDFCGKSGDLYDLDEMNGPYWTRLDFFLREARNRKIVIQIEIWDRFDWYARRQCHY